MKLLPTLLTLVLLAAPAVLRADPLSSEVLAEMNLARTEPQRYAALLSARSGGRSTKAVEEAVRFLGRASALPPLAFSPGMSQAAGLHVAEQGARGKTGHGNPWARMARYGQWLGSAGENIYYGARDARGIVCGLIVDEGVRGRGHRKNIFNGGFRVTGIACGPHATYRAMCVTDFAGSFIERGVGLAVR